MKAGVFTLLYTYEPVHYKTFAGALEAFFEQECPQIGGSRIRQALVNAIYSMVLKFFPETSHLRQGQTVWTTVHKNAKGAYGKTIRDTELTPQKKFLVLLPENRSGEKGWEQGSVLFTGRVSRED